MQKAQVYAKDKYVRTSTKKVGIVMDLVRGLNASEAKRVLTFDQTKAAKLILKVLNSAMANAKHNFDLNEDSLYVSELFVENGPTIKRGHFVGRGRFSPILKRTAHIVVGLSERKK
ncbi:MAG: 50S ribosomal protein L22 [Patescibacteria group bacterium]